MKTLTIAAVATLTLFHLGAFAQNAPLIPLPPVTLSQYNQMVQEGTQFIAVTPAAIAAQNQQVQAANAQNQAIVNAYMNEFPNSGLAPLVTPPNDSTLVPTGDDYTIQVTNAAGEAQTIELLGQDSILADLATSIQAAADPAQQAALYQTLYNQYTVLYGKVCANSPVAASSPSGTACANLPSPSTVTNPAVLQNASLDDIENVLASLASEALEIVQSIPIPLPAPMAVPFGSCTSDVGASVNAETVNSVGGIIGDQAGAEASCETPDPAGILANFGWTGKDLLTCVKNQGARGTCHIFASTSAMEELIARDTGSHVNLSEQDFHENEKLNWHRDLFNNGGSAYRDLTDANKHTYQFAYENQWDYNPSVDKTASSPVDPTAYKGYALSCLNTAGAEIYPYPYPIAGITEPGCSDDAPQAPGFTFESAAYLYTASLTGARSPYMSDGASNILNFSNKPLTVAEMILSLAFQNAVIWAFKETPNFTAATRDASRAKADGLPTGYVQPVSDLQSVSDAKNTNGGGHVVHVVAYFSNSQLAANPATAAVPPDPDGGYFVVKNSWGVCHGDAGFYYVPVSYLEARASGVYIVYSESH